MCNCQYNITDNELEELWQDLEDIPLYENEDYELCLDTDWRGWEKGTNIQTIWHWFDEHHSKGVGWLMNEYEPDILSGGCYE